MALYKNDRFVADLWTALPAGAAVPAQGHAILTLEQWLAQRDILIDGTAPLALRLEAGVALEPILPDLQRFAMIALVFPKFSDGRAFSTAKILRIEQNYGGEIRAVGDAETTTSFRWIADSLRLNDTLAIPLVTLTVSVADAYPVTLTCTL